MGITAYTYLIGLSRGLNELICIKHLKHNAQHMVTHGRISYSYGHTRYLSLMSSIVWVLQLPVL